ncbi:MAG: phage tail protein I [Xanthomonadaceae bacterium]|nr:phage tail protein I [Xanthomonadaceae bacterium]
MSDSLLPPNATQFERALEAATLRIDAIPTPLRTLWDPDTISAPLLPWLAWGLSVDEWDSTWTTAQKRAVVRASINVHQHKGTVGAMLTALAALDYGAQLIEWHQTSPAGAPYTFAIRVALDARGIIDGTWGEVERTALDAKNARSHLTAIQLLHTSPSPAVMATAITAAEIVTIQPWQIAQIDSAGPQYIGASITARETVTISPQVH